MKIKLIAGIAILLCLVILVSGCTEDGDEREGAYPGIRITDFFADFNSIDAGEQMSLALDFENRGDWEATNVNGELIRTGAFTVDPDPYDSTTRLEEPLGDVYSSDEFVWTITAPSVSQDRTEEVQARLYYNYTTIGYATIHFVPRDIIREQGVGSFDLDSSSTLGPLDIELSANQPFTIRDEDIEVPANTSMPSHVIAEIRVTVILDNDGDGQVESLPGGAQCTEADDDCVDVLKITSSGSPSCKLASDSTNTFLNATTTVKMIQGQEGRQSFTFRFNITDVNAATSCQIRARANYRYRVDSSVLPIGIIATE